MAESEKPRESRKNIYNITSMKGLNKTLSVLEKKYGSAEETLRSVNLQKSDDCIGSHCEYAIGDPDCIDCKSAMNY